MKAKAEDMRRRDGEGEEEKQLWEKEVWRERVKVPTILQTTEKSTKEVFRTL